MVEFSDMHFLATVLEREFSDYKLCITEMQQWPTYEDFVMDREGCFIGMSWAGLEVVQVEVPFRLFTRWVDLTGTSRSLQDLDDFAMRRWLRAKHPEWNPRLVRSQPTSLVADGSGQLFIPLHSTEAEAWRGRVLPEQTDFAAHHELAGEIAKECLDPAG